MAGGLLLLATYCPGRMGSIPNVSQPNPGPRPAWSPCILGTKSKISRHRVTSVTFWRLWHEVDRARLRPEVLAGAVDPRVDALHLVGWLTQPHVPEMESLSHN